MAATLERAPEQVAPPADAVERAKREERRKRRRKQAAGHGLLLPATLWLLIFLILPLVVIGIYAFAGERGTLGQTHIGSPGFANFSQVFAGNYILTFFRALWFSFLVVAVTLALGYPLAYFIVRFGGRWQPVWLLFVMVPFWTSYLARMYAWRSLMSTDGLVNTVLGWFGVGNVSWLGNPLAVVLVLAYSFLPFMILPLYISIDRMDFRLVEASYDLGAGRVSTFLRVTVRQTLPGILGGTMLVFIPCVGDFATAQIIGLNTDQTKMVGQQIQDLFGKGNYPLGSALSMLLMVFIVVGMLLYIRAVGREEGGF